MCPKEKAFRQDERRALHQSPLQRTSRHSAFHLPNNRGWGRPDPLLEGQRVTNSGDISYTEDQQIRSTGEWLLHSPRTSRSVRDRLHSLVKLSGVIVAAAIAASAIGGALS